MKGKESSSSGGPGTGFSKDATPFVPSTGAPAQGGGVAGTFKVTAAPFVPGGGPGSGNKAGGPLLMSNAQPFVPASHKGPAASSTSGGSTGQGGTATPSHFGRHGHGMHAGSPHRGRAAANNSSSSSNSTITALATPLAPSSTSGVVASPNMATSASTPTPSSGSSSFQAAAGAAGGFSSSAGGPPHSASPLGGGRASGGRGGRGEVVGAMGRGRGRAPAFMTPSHAHSEAASPAGFGGPGASLLGPSHPHPAAGGASSSPGPGGGHLLHGPPHSHVRGASSAMAITSPSSSMGHSHASHSSGHSGAMLLGGGPSGRPISSSMMGPSGYRPGYGHAHGKQQPPGRSNMQAKQFVDEGLRQQLAAAAYTVQAQWMGVGQGGSLGHQLLPDRISHYHTLLPLDTPPSASSSSPAPTTTGVAALGEAYSPALGVCTLVLKGVSSHDGQGYALRRIDGKQVAPTPDVLACAQQAVEAWGPLAQHPQLVALRTTFVSSELDATAALYMVYDFHPGCVTLAALHLAPSVGAGGCVSVVAPTEHQLWSYLVQLTSLLNAVHGCGLALKPSCLHASKVLVSPTGRLRVNCCGLVGAINGEPPMLDTGSTGSNSSREELAAAHRADLTALGQLLLALACAGLVPPGHAGSMEVLTAPAGAARVRPELARLIAALLAAQEGGPLSSVRQLAAYPALVEHTLMHLDSSSSYVDTLMSELAKECENGRLLRLLIKLCFVVERPEGDMDGSWAETGDRYLLKLFRDFVFHQVVPEGSPGAGGPMLDWGHVIEALNKLDAGVPERLMLLARDEAAMLIASYADLKRCVEHSYSDLHHSHHAHSKV